MPSGKTHDRLTWLLAAPLAAGGWFMTRHLGAVAALTGSFLFAGLMFSGDLDTKSVQYRRWGWFRWIWIPYRKLVSHRSPFSHGPVLGILTRLLYLSFWLVLLTTAVASLPQTLKHPELTAQSKQFAGASARLLTDPRYALMLITGLWAGGFSHTLADETVSHLKKWRRRTRRKPGKKHKSS